MESSKQKLYRSNPPLNDRTHFPRYQRGRISPLFPVQFFEYVKRYETEHNLLDDPDFKHDPVEPLTSVRVPVRLQEMATKEQEFKYNFGVKGIKHLPHVEIDFSVSSLKRIRLAKHLKHVRSLAILPDKSREKSADPAWLCNNVLKFMSNLEELKIIPSQASFYPVHHDISENGFEQLVCCISKNLKKLESLHLVVAQNSNDQKCSPKFLRLVTRHPTTYLINLKHYNLDLQVEFALGQEDEKVNEEENKKVNEEEEDDEKVNEEEDEKVDEDEHEDEGEGEDEDEKEEKEQEQEQKEEEEEDKEKGRQNFSRWIAFDKSRFLRNIKELDLGVSWWDIRHNSTRSRKLAFNIALQERDLKTFAPAIPGLFKHSKSLESFHLGFHREMREPAARFFQTLMKGISLGPDSLENLKFDLSRGSKYLHDPFSKFNFALAKRDKIKALDIYFHPYYNFTKYDELESEEEAWERAKNPWRIVEDKVCYELFTTKIIPQLTNLTSLKLYFQTEKTLNDQLVLRFAKMITKKLTKLENLSLLFRGNEEITKETVEIIEEYFSDKSRLPDLKNLRIDFNYCEGLYSDFSDLCQYINEGRITKEKFKEIQDEFHDGRPETKCFVTLDQDDSFVCKEYHSDEEEEDLIEDLLERDDSDDSDENLSDFLEYNEEEDYNNLLRYLKHSRGKGIDKPDMRFM